jgi:DNA-binding NarL/FixJ family response regulator
MEFDVVGEAGDGSTAIKMARELNPDVILMDIRMPDVNGIEATRRIRSEIPGTKVIALTMCSDRHFIREMMEAGVSGYVLKHSAPEELATAIHAVTEGRFYACAEIADIIEKDGHPQKPPTEVS